MQIYFSAFFLVALSGFMLPGCTKNNDSDSRGCIARQVWKASDLLTGCAKPVDRIFYIVVE